MRVEVSGTGALVGGVVGALARAGVSYWYLGSFLERHAKDVPDVVGISAQIGFVVGVIAGSAGRPVLGACVGAILGAIAYHLTMIPMAFCFCLLTFNREPPPAMEELIFPMAVAGALSGLAGGGAQMVRDQWKRKRTGYGSDGPPGKGPPDLWYP